MCQFSQTSEQNGNIQSADKTGLALLPGPLLEWYRANARTLPWRREPTPYHVWVSEIMLQQTRVAAVLGYYGRFMEALPTIQELAGCPEERLMKLWQGLGYYNRARSLQKAARQVMEEFSGAFPEKFEDIRTLAGVGDYTAGAIASIAFGQAVPAVDGNVMRVAARITGDGREMDKPVVKRQVGAELQRVMPRERPGDFNQALMELGALVCLPNGAPLCESCPAREFCAAHRTGRTGELPVKAKKKPRKTEARMVYLIFHKGRVALRRRPDKGLLAGLWEYPNEAAPWAAPVEGKAEPAGKARHVFTHVQWNMEAILIRAETGTLPEGWVWASREELDGRYAVPSAFSAFTETVLRELDS